MSANLKARANDFLLRLFPFPHHYYCTLPLIRRPRMVTGWVEHTQLQTWHEVSVRINSGYKPTPQPNSTTVFTDEVSALQPTAGADQPLSLTTYRRLFLTMHLLTPIACLRHIIWFEQIISNPIREKLNCVNTCKNNQIGFKSAFVVSPSFMGHDMDTSWLCVQLCVVPHPSWPHSWNDLLVGEQVTPLIHICPVPGLFTLSSVRPVYLRCQKRSHRAVS